MLDWLAPSVLIRRQFVRVCRETAHSRECDLPRRVSHPVLLTLWTQVVAPLLQLAGVHSSARQASMVARVRELAHASTYQVRLPLTRSLYRTKTPPQALPGWRSSPPTFLSVSLPLPLTCLLLQNVFHTTVIFPSRIVRQNVGEINLRYPDARVALPRGGGRS